MRADMRWRGLAAAGVVVSGLLVAGCAWVEGIGRALGLAAQVAEAPAQIDALTLDPPQVTILGTHDQYCNVFFPPAVTRARWRAAGKRIELVVDGTVVHRQSTPEVRDVIAGEGDVAVSFTSAGQVTLRAFNAVDQATQQTLVLPITWLGAPTNSPCTTCPPPCTCPFCGP